MYRVSMNKEKPFLTGKYTIPPPQISMDESSPADSAFSFSDVEFPIYQTNYQSIRNDDLSKYYGVTTGYEGLESKITKFLIDGLTRDCPDAFSKEMNDTDLSLICHPAQERLKFDSNYHLTESVKQYEAELDAIASLIQEDLAVVHIEEDGNNSLVAAHVTAPNYWNPGYILGKNLFEIHAVVPGLPPIGPDWASLLAKKESRVVQMQWGVTTDDRLNHHPDRPANWSGADDEWSGRKFEPDNPSLYVRVERQIFIGFGDCFLFIIRTYFHDCKTLQDDEKTQLAEAIKGMDSETRRYKGVADEQNDAVRKWLTNPQK